MIFKAHLSYMLIEGRRCTCNIESQYVTEFGLIDEIRESYHEGVMLDLITEGWEQHKGPEERGSVCFRGLENSCRGTANLDTTNAKEGESKEPRVKISGTSSLIGLCKCRGSFDLMPLTSHWPYPHPSV